MTEEQQARCAATMAKAIAGLEKHGQQAAANDLKAVCVEWLTNNLFVETLKENMTNHELWQQHAMTQLDKLIAQEAE